MAITFASLYHNTDSDCGDTSERDVHKHVEQFVGGRVLSTSATPVIEEVLFDQALLHHLVYAGRKMAGSLSQSGLSVQLQYCSSATHGHPIPFLVTRNQSGELVVPTSTPHETHCSGSTFYLVECQKCAEDPHRAISTNASQDPIIARIKGAIVVIPTQSSKADSRNI
jgi:hypothetical protein